MGEGSWERDGFVIERGVLDPGTIDGLRSHLETLMRRSPAAAAAGLLAGTVVDDDRWSAAVSDARLVAVAESLLGRVELFSSCWVVKPPRSALRAGWHQDGGGWPVHPQDAVTVWVALDESAPESGGLRVIPGSHGRGALPHHRDDARLAGNDLFPVWTEEVHEPAAVDIRLSPGDVSAHHPLLVHGSGPNGSDRPRRALVIRYRRTARSHSPGAATAPA